MTMQQPEALRLAEKLRDMCSQFDTPSHERGVVNGAIQELRRLQERLEASHKSNADWATRTHALEAVNAKLRAELDELKEQMAAIGAGGVEPLRKRAAIVSDAQIKAVFLANGFTIKEGLTDLKPYVYQAARALLATGGQAQAVERWIGIGKAIERACMDLPDGTEISVSLEKDAGTVTLIDQDGNEHENFSCDYGFAGVLNEAIDAALAAQTKHGEAQQ